MIFVAIVGGVFLGALGALVPLYLLIYGGEALLGRVHLGRGSRFLLLLLKSSRRNPLRTALSYLAVFVLVGLVVTVWSALHVLDRLIAFKAGEIKMVVSERWQSESELPISYARRLCEGGADPSRPDSVWPTDAMTWQFYLGTIDPANNTRDSQIFFIALEPRKAPTLMDRTYDDVPFQSPQRSGPKLAQTAEFMEAVARMENDRRCVIIGRKVLTALNKRVGERIKVTGMNFKDIDLEMEIVGTFPEGRFDDTAIMHRDYLNSALALYATNHPGQKHEKADRSLSLVVLEVPDVRSYNQVAEQIETSTEFRNPAVKCETLAAYAVSQLEGYRDIIWGMRWLLSPASLITTGLILANAISLSVRERRKEMAVLKVLGYRPAQILLLVLGEAMLISGLAGLISSLLVYHTVNEFADFADFVLPLYIPDRALWWGPVVGILTGWAGSLLPAWMACRVHVATVFARVG
jgi:putative ABC transport system permease protein